MRHVQIGEDKASVIGLGTWQFGAKEWDWDPAQRDDAIRIVHRALELGINVIDTAEAYSKGESESIIGEALVERREQAFLASKLLPLMPLPGRIVKAATASLKRMGTDHMELYQIHWPNPVVPLGVQMKGMRAVHAAGQAKYLGVSNFTLGMWKRAERALGGPVMTNQVQYNMLRRKAECLLPWAQQNGRVVIAYSPLAQGMLSGKYAAGNAPGGVRKINLFFTKSNMEAAKPVLTALKEISAKHDATSAQIALAWLVHHPNVIAIPGARSVAQLEQNAAAGDIELAEDEFVRLTEAADAFQRAKAGIGVVPQLVGRLVRG
ncbi:MAG: aldo/keto reductase [bacterium]|nr:aldo/keto reductase [bacterium]